MCLPLRSSNDRFAGRCISLVRISRTSIRDRTLRLGRYLARHAESRVRTVLEDTRIVALVGPWQSGLTTLVRRVPVAGRRPSFNLDDEQFKRFARDDPVGFLRGRDAPAIDEVRRAPNLFRALKKAVDENPLPGRHLVAGSADLSSGAVSPDSLAGRVEVLELLPFSRAEVAAKRRPRFLDRTFERDPPSFAPTSPTGAGVDRVVAGGIPEVVSGALPERRSSWLRSYAQALALREIADLASVRKTDGPSRLVGHAARSAGQLLNLSALGAGLGLDGKPVDRLLGQMLLVRRIPAWHRNEAKRLVKSSKLRFLDAGLLAALRRATADVIARDRRRIGPLLECFVHS